MACLGPTFVNVKYKAEGHKYRLNSEEHCLRQGNWLLWSKVGINKGRISRIEKGNACPRKKKIEFHHGCQDPRILPKK